MHIIQFLFLCTNRSLWILWAANCVGIDVTNGPHCKLLFILKVIKLIHILLIYFLSRVATYIPTIPLPHLLILILILFWILILPLIKTKPILILCCLEFMDLLLLLGEGSLLFWGAWLVVGLNHSGLGSTLWLLLLSVKDGLFSVRWVFGQAVTLLSVSRLVAICASWLT